MVISRRQLFWILYTVETSAMELFAIRSTVLLAKQDSWLSMLIGGVIGLAITWVSVRISLLFPNQTLVEFCQVLFGKWLGRLAVIPYFLMALFGLSMILRQLSDFVHMAWFVRTPLWVLVLGLVWLMVYAAYSGGIEGIARCGEIIGPITMLTVGMALFLNWGNFHFGQLLPVYADTGWRALFAGGLPSAAFFGQSVIVMMMVPFLKEKDKAMVSALTAITAVIATLVLSAFFIIAVFGPGLSAEMLYPAYEVTRFISVLDFLQSVDSVIVIAWILGYFMQLSTYFFLICYATGQWLEIKRWRLTIFLIAPVLVVGALLPQGYSFSSITFPRDIWTRYVLPINMIALPLIFWGFAAVRKRWHAAS